MPLVEIRAFLRDPSREADGPAREVYLNGPEEELRMEIAVPMR